MWVAWHALSARAVASSDVMTALSMRSILFCISTMGTLPISASTCRQHHTAMMHARMRTLPIQLSTAWKESRSVVEKATTQASASVHVWCEGT